MTHTSSASHLTPDEVRSLKRKTVLGTCIMFSPMILLLALPLYLPWARRTGIVVRPWEIATIHTLILLSFMYLGSRLAKCPRCSAQLGVLRVPAVCDNCRTVLLPGTDESVEVLAGLSRPRIGLSETQLEQHLRARRRFEWSMGVAAVAIGAIIVATSVFGWSGLAATAALPIVAGVLRIAQRSLKCPNCGESESLDRNGDCRHCGAMLSRPKQSKGISGRPR